ncbi:myosin-16-like isoform X2 [Biomphalaria glabrata]|nr:myosin-16-like isoform X2 [Biomphalaria glabrata]
MDEALHNKETSNLENTNIVCWKRLYSKTDTFLESTVLNPSPQHLFVTQISLKEKYLLCSLEDDSSLTDVESLNNSLEQSISVAATARSHEEIFQELESQLQNMEARHQKEMMELKHQHEMHIIELESTLTTKLKSLETESSLRERLHEEEMKELRRQLEKQQVQSQLDLGAMKHKYSLDTSHYQSCIENLQSRLLVKELEHQLQMKELESQLRKQFALEKKKLRKANKSKNRK